VSLLYFVALCAGSATLFASETFDESGMLTPPLVVTISHYSEAQEYIDAAFALIPDKIAKAQLQSVVSNIMNPELDKLPLSPLKNFCKHVRAIARIYASPSPCAIACLALLYVESSATLLTDTPFAKQDDFKGLISALFDKASIESAKIFIGLKERDFNPGFALGFK
jgi:hypothetical protein